MSGNGKELQADPNEIVSGVHLGLRANGGLHIELMGQPLPPIVILGMLAKAQHVIQQPRQSNIVVPELNTGGMDLRS